ncbi:MAG: TonB-dependent receptor [Treponema sp.]|jgi:vitamin B12 transporter|nr:TonB-dependent receptor [Treponema sp.]
MRRSFGVFFFILFLFFLFPLQAQDAGDDFYDDEELPLVESEGITVVGTQETTQQMAVVSREEIEKAHAPDIPALLEQTLGLGITRYGPYGNMADVNIRGFDTERTAVLVDGIPVNSTRSGEFDFNSIDVNSIERIEVIYGGSDTKYNVSGALGGVINIVTVKKQGAGWVFGGGVSNTSALPGPYNEQYGGVGNPKWQDLADAQNINVFAAYGAENYSFRMNLFGNRAGNHYLYQDYYGYARRKEGNELWDGGASASFLRNFPNLSTLIVTGDAYYGDKHIPASGYTAEYAEQKDFSTRQNIMLDMPRAFHDDFSMEFSLGHNWGILNYDPGLDPSLHRENGFTLINRWAWYPATGFTLRFGGDYRFIHLNSTNDGVHNGHRGGLYLTSEYAPVKKILLIASVKGVTDGGSVIPVPKAGIAWSIHDTFTIKNNYFRSFKFPDFDDLYWVQQGFMGNPDLKPEDGWGADLSAEWTRGDLLTLASSLYGEWTTDSIHWNNASGLWRPENISRAVFLGWENRLNITLPFAPPFPNKPVISLSWQFQLSRLLDGNARIPYMPMHILGFSMELPWKIAGVPQGSLIVSGRFESSRFADTGNLIKLDPYFLLNVTVNQEIGKNITLFGSVRNVLNTRYVSVAEYPMPGITLTLGLRMTVEVPQKEKGVNPRNE